MLLHWVWFAQLPRLSELQKRNLLRHFHDPEEIYHCQESAFAAFDWLTQPMLEALRNRDLVPAQRILQECEEKGLGIITLQDEAYPPRLRNTADGPAVLYFKGALPGWDRQPVIGIVGTRRATPYGLSTAARFGEEIAACGALVISGGASGIDTMAMEGALAAGKQVVGVLGCGLDVVYPRSNRNLFERICENGCLLSEYPPRTQALSWHFPQRNRIITGISNGLLVVEAPERSGALNSARHAWEQGREVFAVPGNVGVDACAGSNALLQERAIPALCGWDVVKEFVPLWPWLEQRESTAKVYAQGQPLQVAQAGNSPAPKQAKKNAPAKKDIDKGGNSPYSVVNSGQVSLSEQEQAVLALLDTTPVAVDDVIHRSGLPAGTVKAILTKLTIKGVTVGCAGGRICRK